MTQRHRHTAGSGRHKTTSPHDPPACHHERFECYMVERELTTCSEDEVDAPLEENIKKQQPALWDQSELPLAGAFFKAADMLDDNFDDGISHDGICYAAIPDLHGTRISADGICSTGEVGVGIFEKSQLMGRGPPQLWKGLYFFGQKENDQPRQISLSGVLAVPDPILLIRVDASAPS